VRTIRLAALLHLTKGPRALSEPIEAETMRAAIGLIDYYTEHARTAFVAMGTDETTADAQYVLDHLRRDEIKEFTVRELHMKLGTNRFPKVDDLKAAVNLLEDHYWIRVKPQSEQTGPGRKRSPAYLTQFTQCTESTDRWSSVDSVNSVTKESADTSHDGVDLCPHGMSAGHLPDPFVGGRLKCTECRREATEEQPR
jgi:hypothetical protein